MQMNNDTQAGCSMPWYVAHTKPRQERVAMENLARQGYGIYLPQLKVLKGLRNTEHFGFEALFPRYLFFRPGHREQSIAPVRSTHGVTTIVRFGGLPAVLRPELLESIRAFEIRQNAADYLELSALRPGATVSVIHGPLAGLEGLITMVSRQRVVVLMRLLGSETRVRMAPRDVKLAA